MIVETVYEAWILKIQREVEEDAVVTDPNTGEQSVKRRKRQLTEEEFVEQEEPILDKETDSVAQFKSRANAEGAAKKALEEEGGEKAFIREVKTVAEIRPKTKV